MVSTRKLTRPSSPKDSAKKRKTKKVATKSLELATPPTRKSKRTIKSKASSTLSNDKKPKKKGHKKTNLKKAIEQNRGVVYLSHLPHGFYEKQLREYCRQFGVVTGVHVPRNEKGNAKGFGFVEFQHPEVAEVVAETMNNYLMFNRLIKAKTVPLEDQKPWLFISGINPVKAARKKKADALAARERILTPQEEERYKTRAQSRVTRLRSKLQEKGINYEFTVAS